MEENPTDENIPIQVTPVEKESRLVGEKSPIKEQPVAAALEDKCSGENAPEAKTPEAPPPETKAPEQENSPEETKKPDVIKEKKMRRRSSLGTLIANAFIAPGTEDTMSPVEPRKPIRPRRSVLPRIVQPVPVARPPPPPQLRPIRYSFDLGERVAVKSCLKPTSSFERTRAVPPQKSLTQQTADKIIAKYRKSGGFIDTKTPINKRKAKLKFHSICSIRVITPRPDYNPDKLEMPHSDDEAEKESNPNRERLSTVELQLTPTSQSQLVEIRESDVVQFNATMVFGDGDPFIPTTSSSCSEADIAMAEDAETVVTSGTSEVDSEPKTIEKKKKSSRRKSLILGSASPMKSPAKIEKPRFDEDVEELVDFTSEQPRKSRRSVRLNKNDIIEKPTQELDVVLHEREESSQKKRGIVHDPVPNEPNPKRSRRKSGFIRKEDDEGATEESEKKKEQTTIHPFFAPKKAEETVKKKVEEKISKKTETACNTEKKFEKTKKPEEKEKVRKRTRRSSAYFGKATEDNISIKSDDIIVISEPSQPSTSTEKDTEVGGVTEVIASSSSSSSTLSSHSSREKRVNKEVPKSPNPGKLATIFASSPAQVKKIAEVKESEASTSTFQSPTPSTPKSSSKLFSLFSPKPKSKLDSSSCDSPITISDSPLVPPKIKEIVKCPRQSSGVKRQEYWGDKHPETYEFMLRMPTQQSIFEGTTPNSFDENLFKSRPFDESILNVDDVNSNLEELRSEDSNLLIMKKSEKVKLDKVDGIDGHCTTDLYPSSMEHLVEGAEEGKTIEEWLKKWKRRVRKNIDREEKEKDRRKNGSKRGRRKKDESDDDDYEMDGDDLENPLILIGPTGVGKTALYRALAKQENMRTITIGPETDRSGAEIKRKLFEALRSHRVDQQPHQALSAFFKTVKQSEYGAREKDPKDFVQSLVVFEHVDVFFDTLDRHGINGLLEVINDSAVPVVFTCENDWPRGSGQVELKRRCLEIHMTRNEKKIQRYVQKVIYSCRNVAINDSAILQLSKSVNHDLRALIHQAHFFSLAPKVPFPLSSRKLAPCGFRTEWEKPRNALRNGDENDRLEHLIDMYSGILSDCSINSLYPKIERSWDKDRQQLAVKQSAPLDDLQSAYEALNGRYSKRDLAMDILPLLVPIDRVEKAKKVYSRRHCHRFKEHSEIRTDGDSLISVVGRWGFKKD